MTLSPQKADKSALAATVTRMQFDATTEQLNNMMQELVAKVSGQEQDWQKVVDKILVEMDNKVRGRGDGPAGLGGKLRDLPDRLSELSHSHPPAAEPSGAGPG